MTKDVIIIGGGIIGCSTAWQLSKLGKSVLVIEKKDIASGSAGATDGVVGYHTKQPGFQMDLAIKSIEMFENLAEELGEDIEYSMGIGGMQLIEDKEQWDIISEMAQQQRKSGVDIRMISAQEAREIEPNLTEDIYGALYSPTSGKINPLKLTLGFAHGAKKLGAEFKTYTTVTDIIIEEGAVKGVKTTEGDYYANVVVNACGARAAEVAKLAGFDFPIKARKGQLAVTEPIAHFLDATVQCARYNLIKFRPEAVNDKVALRLGATLSIEQTHDGGFIIGGTREFVDFEEENTFEAIEKMMSRTVRFFPLLKDTNIVRFFSGFRPYTPDGMPLMGEVNGLKGFFMAAGHEGDGIALSPVTGLLLAEQIVYGKPSYNIDAFSPNRFL